LKVFKLTQRGIPIYVTIMPAADLVSMMKYDRFGLENPHGYQRDLDEAQVAKTVRFLLKEEGTFPTSVLMNFRGKATFTAETSNDGIEMGTLKLPKDELQVVDGQHRLAALERMVHEYPGEYSNYPLIVSIFTFDDPDRYNEMRQFYLVTSRAKKVSLDLALKYLCKLYEKHGQAELAEREGVRKVFEVEADEVAMKLNSDPNNPAWYGRVQLIGENEKPEHIIGERALAISIAPIIRERMFIATSTSELATLLRDYWMAIKDLYAQAFASPKDYTIQATPGANAFHTIFPSVYVKCLEAGGYSKDKVKEILGKLKEPSPRVRDEKPLPIIDDNFWNKKKGDPLAIGTSKKVMGMLAATLAGKLKL